MPHPTMTGASSIRFLGEFREASGRLALYTGEGSSISGGRHGKFPLLFQFGIGTARAGGM